MVVDGYRQAATGSFTKDALAETYVMAFRSNLKESSPAAEELISSYLNNAMEVMTEHNNAQMDSEVT